jgi:uncharacterized delta-60 repeat protein
MKKIIFLLIFSNSISYSQTDGSLDNTFGTNGKVITDLSSSSTDYAYDGIRLADDKILVAGLTNFSGSDNNLLIKYLPNGQLDTSFGINGISIIKFGNDRSQVRKIATQSDGKIILAGRSSASLTAYATIARINSDGTLDTTFGTNGYTKKVSGSESDIQSLIILPDDKIIVVGYVLNNNADIQVIKLNADGSYDNSFGTNGIAVINFDSLSQRAFCSVMNGDKILIGGVVYNPNESSLLLQLNPNGSIDNSFGVNGYSYAQFGSNPYNRYDRFLSIKIFENKIYGVGSRAVDSFNNSINLAKFTIDGLLDTSFSDDGKLLIDTSSKIDFINDLNILQDNSILLAGVSSTSSSSSGLLIKLKPDGNYKINFGVNGIISSANFTTIQKVIINETNIIAIGNINSPTNVVLAKYNNSNLLNIKKNQFKNTSFNIYPNPVEDKLNITSLSEQKINAVVILDVLGKKVLEQNQNINQLNIENFPKGIYFLKIYSDGLIEDFKLIKY